MRAVYPCRLMSTDPSLPARTFGRVYTYIINVPRTPLARTHSPEHTRRFVVVNSREQGHHHGNAVWGEYIWRVRMWDDMVFRCGSLGTSPGMIKEFRRGASADAIALFEINEVLDGSFIYIFIVTCVRVVLVWFGALPVSRSVGIGIRLTD